LLARDGARLLEIPVAGFGPDHHRPSILVLCEVLADKFPGLDHVWDFIHTLLRPVAGALAAGATVSTDNILESALAMLMEALPPQLMPLRPRCDWWPRNHGAANRS
jgi:hypothetical protein